MRIVDDELRSTFNCPGVCERCGKWFMVRECHHAFLKRNPQIDVRENLVGLCGGPRGCHNLAENYTGIADDVRFIVAKREGRDVDEIKQWLWHIARTDKAAEIPPKPWEQVTA